MGKNINRRDMLKSSAILASGLSLSPGLVSGQPQQRASMSEFRQVSAKPLEIVRIGIIGVGNRGTSILKEILKIDSGYEVNAICDLVEGRVKAAQELVVEKMGKKPEGYSKGKYDYRNLCNRDDIDLVLVLTPWEWHAPMCIDAMKADKHTATEVPGAQTLEECWELVETSEETNKHCILLENYCYFRETMAILKMLREGVLGDPTMAYAGYQKESNYYNFNADGSMTFSSEFKSTRMGNTYPTHHVGPVAQWMDINRGDSFDYLVCMGTYAEAFNNYGRDIFGENHPLANQKFDMSDINSTLIRTKKGRVINLILDTCSPRPHRHYFRLQATNGIYEHIEKRIHVQGKSPGEWTKPRSIDPETGKWIGQKWEGREWEPFGKYMDEYEHPLWKELDAKNIKSGHQGADFPCFYRLIQSLRKGVEPDIDVYDLAAWSCIVDLSEKSARNRSQAIDIPDFTRGKWKVRKPIPLYGAAI